MNAASLSDRSLKLAAVQHEHRPKCQSCKLLRVYDTATGPTWRCEECLRYYTGRIEQRSLIGDFGE